MAVAQVVYLQGVKALVSGGSQASPAAPACRLSSVEDLGRGPWSGVYWRTPACFLPVEVMSPGRQPPCCCIIARAAAGRAGSLTPVRI